jgi:general stress protein 26
MDLEGLVQYVRSQPDAVISSLTPDGAPQSAYLDMTATDLGELVFNAREASRKIANIRTDPRVSVVVGGRDGTTLQCEGVGGPGGWVESRSMLEGIR